MYWWKLKRHVHASWLIAGMAGGVIAGIILCPYFTVIDFRSPVWLGVGVFSLILCLWRARFYVIPFVVIAGMLVGFWRGAFVQAELSPYKSLIGHTVTVRGSVGDDLETDKKGMTIVRMSVEAINDHPMQGRIWVTVRQQTTIQRSDKLIVRGKLDEGFGSYASSMYRADVMLVQRPMPGDVAGQIRSWFGERVREVITGDPAALGIGFLTGQNQSLSPELMEAMKTAGLTHIVVASGYNLTILVRLARRLFVGVSKYLTAVFSTAMISGFLTITGLSPSMSRAGLVAGLSLLAWYYGRKFHPLVLLPFVAAITLLINPNYGWNDLGWQLSFAAFGGVMVLAPLLQAYFFGKKKPGIVRQILGETVAAQIATLPILAGAFGQISCVALAANLLVVPLVPLVMLLVFMTGMTTVIWVWFAGVIGSLADVILRYMIGVTQSLANIPWAAVELSVPWYVSMGSYVIIAGMCWYMWRATKYNLREANLVE